jgi:hypothetical protein
MSEQALRVLCPLQVFIQSDDLRVVSPSTPLFRHDILKSLHVKNLIKDIMYQSTVTITKWKRQILQFASDDPSQTVCQDSLSRTKVRNTIQPFTHPDIIIQHL